MNIISPVNAYKIIHKCMFFSERTFDVSNYSSAISSIAFSKCTTFFNNCLIEPSLIITKSPTKLKVISSENYCSLHSNWIKKNNKQAAYLGNEVVTLLPVVVLIAGTMEIRKIWAIYLTDAMPWATVMARLEEGTEAQVEYSISNHRLRYGILQRDNLYCHGTVQVIIHHRRIFVAGGMLQLWHTSGVSDWATSMFATC